MCTAEWPLLMYSNRRSEAATAAAVTSLKNRIVVNKTKIRLVAHFAMLARLYYACQTILSHLPFHVTLLFSLFILEEHNFCTGTLGLLAMYVHFRTFKDFGTSQVYQVTKDDENLKC